MLHHDEVVSFSSVQLFKLKKKLDFGYDESSSQHWAWQWLHQFVPVEHNIMSIGVLLRCNRNTGDGTWSADINKSNRLVWLHLHAPDKSAIIYNYSLID